MLKFYCFAVDRHLETERSRKMSDDFKQKLEKYEKGELSGEELVEFEKELAKLEDYQTVLNQDIDEPPKFKINQRKIMFKGKWKARLQTAFTVLGILFIFTFFSSLITNIYYTTGTTNKMDHYQEIIEHYVTVTDPYGQYGGTSIGTKVYFGLEATKDINKMVGRDTIKVGEMEVNFLFSLMGYPIKNDFGKQSQETILFTHPHSDESFSSDWEQLEHLPEGTVVSAYITFNDLLSTDTVLDLFLEKEIELLWLAVDNGKPLEEDYGAVFNPVGFPSSPIWHDDDMIVDFQETEEGFFGTRVTMEGASSPEYSEGDQTMIHEQFIKTLQFLKKHERKASKIIDSRLDIEETLNYIDQNGIHHYGAVITGPTKEVLKLQEEASIVQLAVDEVAFWNWD